jgi:anti-sigma B factor antagonist
VAEMRRTPLLDGVVCVEIHGEFDLADLPRAEDVVPAALDAASSGFLFDLSRCEFIDSSGVRTLLDAHGRALAAGLRFAIAGAGGNVRRVLELTGLSDQLPVFDDREAALRVLYAAPA